MNNLVLLAKLEYSPELRHTTEGKEVSETVVSFEGKETTHTLKAIAWGKTATSFHQELRQGDVAVLFEGSLQMNTIERPEGFKEKMAEMVVQKFEKINSSSTSTPIQAPAKPIGQNLPEPNGYPVLIMQKAKARVLLIDAIFTKGKCTAQDLLPLEELEEMRIKTIHNHLREMEKEGLVIIKQIENPNPKKKPRNEYSLKCPCPLPGETETCNSCPSGKKIKALSYSSRT